VDGKSFARYINLMTAEHERWNDRQFVIGDIFSEGAIRQDAKNSAHYWLVRFVVGHHDHHLVGGVQEDPASSETSHHWRMSKFCEKKKKFK
jgi:hypothetical protein